MIGLTTTDPEAAEPVLKLVPVHEVALVLDQVTVTAAPEVTAPEDTDIEATGAGVELPPPPPLLLPPPPPPRFFFVVVVEVALVVEFVVSIVELVELTPCRAFNK